MDAPLEEQLVIVTDRIVKAFDPQRIILFGSHAYGHPTPDSDVDLLIIMESNERSVRRWVKTCHFGTINSILPC